VLDRPAASPGAARTWTARHLEVTATAPVHAGIDGEAVELDPPLRFVIRPLALRVRLHRP
jgi:diacylglycerol kinase family enzyme